MGRWVALEGTEAVAYAMKQVAPDVVAAYPITPQTGIVQVFAQFVADGEVHTEFLQVESEHSALSACVGAAAAGSRAMTATSAQGLALMWEILYIAASMRLPIVMPVVNRALSAPINIHCDHSDSMGARDSGWIQIYSENAQEAYDNILQAVRIAEHPQVRLPVMVMMDGFITSHAVERLWIEDDDAVRAFVSTYQPACTLLNLERPLTFGALDFYDYYFEHKRHQVEAMRRAKEAILEVAEDFARRFGRRYALFETYRLEDADVAVVVLSSTAGTARVAVDNLRRLGWRVGLLKPRVYRPFPDFELIQALRHVRAIGVMDRAIAFGAMDDGGPLWLDMLAAAYRHDLHIPIANYVFGLGGRDITPSEIEGIFTDLMQIAERGTVTRPVTYVGVRGEPPLPTPAEWSLWIPEATIAGD